MENASKALIIAGAILLSIAIIGIGMYVYNNAADAMSGTDMTAEQVRTYNQTFTNYEGIQRGANVKTLCDTIANHNRTAADVTEQVEVHFGSDAPGTGLAASDINENNTSTTAINTIKNTNVMSGATYKVTLEYDNTSGRVTAVYINNAA